MVGIFARRFARREVGEDVIEVGVPLIARGLIGRAIRPRAGDERHVDAEFLPRPVGQVVVEVRRRVGKRREDEDLFVWFAVSVLRGLPDLSGDQLLQFGELHVAFRRHIAGRKMELVELVAVVLEIV